VSHDLTIALPDLLTRDELRDELDAFRLALLWSVAQIVTAVNTPDEWRGMNLTEAAALVGVSRSTLRGWVWQHGLPTHRVDGSTVILSDELRIWLAARPGLTTVDDADNEVAA
jgi:excisionase family DNA binding protein